ncbi:hypothetical protein ACTFIY_008215 [Dictyostelium cf. discoideum]
MTDKYNDWVKNKKHNNHNVAEDPLYYIKSNWVLERQLSKGSFGQVYKAHKKLDPNFVCAIKVIQYCKFTMKEVDYLKKLNDPKFVKYYSLEFNNSKTYAYIIMEFIEGESMKSILENKKFSDIEIKEIIKELLKALVYLNDKGIMHRDLKPENIMFQNNQNDKNKINLKLIDFGLSKSINENIINKTVKLQTISSVGTTLYMAPEILLNNKGSNSSLDIWSLGCIIVEMKWGLNQLCLQRPNNIPIFPVNSIFTEILNLCFETEPSKRIKSHQLIKHPFFNDEENDQFYNDNKEYFDFLKENEGDSYIEIHNTESIGSNSSTCSNEIRFENLYLIQSTIENQYPIKTITLHEKYTGISKLRHLNSKFKIIYLFLILLFLMTLLVNLNRHVQTKFSIIQRDNIFLSITPESNPIKTPSPTQSSENNQYSEGSLSSESSSKSSSESSSESSSSESSSISSSESSSKSSSESSSKSSSESSSESSSSESQSSEINYSSNSNDLQPSDSTTTVPPITDPPVTEPPITQPPVTETPKPTINPFFNTPVYICSQKREQCLTVINSQDLEFLDKKGRDQSMVLEYDGNEEQTFSIREKGGLYVCLSGERYHFSEKLRGRLNSNKDGRDCTFNLITQFNIDKQANLYSFRNPNDQYIQSDETTRFISTKPGGLGSQSQFFIYFSHSLDPN